MTYSATLSHFNLIHNGFHHTQHFHPVSIAIAPLIPKTVSSSLSSPAPEFPVRSVEMKGSWDNFQKVYQLKRDGQTGHWRGCHAFESIVCDGVTLDASASRDGGLKMGGTYWYYVRSLLQCPQVPACVS